MANLDKEIRVIAVKGANGQDGKSSYDLAVENELFSGTLEEWIETFATPENYFTRAEIQRVTQAEYDELVETGQVAPNCYYLIIDDTTADDIETALDDMTIELDSLQAQLIDGVNKVKMVSNNTSGIRYILTTDNNTTSGGKQTPQYSPLFYINGDNSGLFLLDDFNAQDFYYWDSDEETYISVKEKIEDLESANESLATRVTTLENAKRHTISFNYSNSHVSGKIYFEIFNHSSTVLTMDDIIESFLNNTFKATGYVTISDTQYIICAIEFNTISSSPYFSIKSSAGSIGQTYSTSIISSFSDEITPM